MSDFSFDIEKSLPSKRKEFVMPAWATLAVKNLSDGKVISAPVKDGKEASSLAAKFTTIGKHIRFKVNYVYRGDEGKVYIKFTKDETEE